MVVARIFACKLQRGFVRLGAGVGKKHALRESEFAQPLRQTNRGFVGKNVCNMPQLAGLLGQRGHRRRVRVAQRAHGDAAGEIDILPAGLVPDPRSFSTHGDKATGGVAGHHHLIEGGTRDRLRCRCHQLLQK